MSGMFRPRPASPRLRVVTVLGLMAGLLAGCTPRRHDATFWCEGRDVRPSPERDACLVELAARRGMQERTRSAGEAAAMGAANALDPRYR